jgi:hypothetical protein
MGSSSPGLSPGRTWPPHTPWVARLTTALYPQRPTNGQSGTSGRLARGRGTGRTTGRGFPVELPRGRASCLGFEEASADGEQVLEVAGTQRGGFFGAGHGVGVLSGATKVISSHPDSGSVLTGNYRAMCTRCVGERDRGDDIANGDGDPAPGSFMLVRCSRKDAGEPGKVAGRRGHLTDFYRPMRRDGGRHVVGKAGPTGA